MRVNLCCGTATIALPPDVSPIRLKRYGIPLRWQLKYGTFRGKRLDAVTSPVTPPLLLRHYQKYLRDPQVWEFMDVVSRHYTKETLGRLLRYGSVASRRAASLALGLLGHAGDTSLIGPGLADRDRAVRLLSEHGIQELWLRGRCDAERRELATIRRLAATHHFLLAMNAATDFALSSRSLAEAWYARAQIRFALHSYRHAFHDACKALSRDKFHFPAATLAGQCQLALNNEALAIRNFQRALRICPDLEHVRLHVHRLKGHDENA